MYTEEVYDCNLPLPYELLRPISFHLAKSLIKDKLRFPWCHDHGGGSYIGTRYGTRGYVLECNGGKHLSWMSLVMPGVRARSTGAVLRPFNGDSKDLIRISESI